MAPQTYRIYQEALATSSVSSIAGRILSVAVEGACVSVLIKTRGIDNVVECRFDQVINCTGPCTDIEKITDPFISYLSNEAMICADALNLGIKVGKNYSVVDASGNSIEWLSYVGPMLRARLWEATAVPELRQHARALAVDVAERFAAVEGGSI
ncbi:hypothetical protein D3C84_933720 [compost metagenome]